MRKFKRTVRAILLLQRVERGRKARVLFRQLLAEKREKERIRLEKTIVIQKYTRGLLQRRKYKVWCHDCNLMEMQLQFEIQWKCDVILQQLLGGVEFRHFGLFFQIILEKHRELLALKEQMEREKRERIEREKREREERERKEAEVIINCDIVDVWIRK